MNDDTSVHVFEVDLKRQYQYLVGLASSRDVASNLSDQSTASSSAAPLSTASTPEKPTLPSIKPLLAFDFITRLRNLSEIAYKTIASLINLHKIGQTTTETFVIEVQQTISHQITDTRTRCDIFNRFARLLPDGWGGIHFDTVSKHIQTQLSAEYDDGISKPRRKSGKYGLAPSGSCYSRKYIQDRHGRLKSHLKQITPRKPTSSVRQKVRNGKKTILVPDLRKLVSSLKMKRRKRQSLSDQLASCHRVYTKI